MNRILLVVLAGLFLFPWGIVCAHDGWIQSNVPRAGTGDMVYIDMQFGNHGNTHRDYKIYSSKWDVNKSTFTLYAPEGSFTDLKSRVIDVGMNEAKTVGGVPYTDKNGYLVTSFLASQRGTYIVDVRQDMVVSYAPERSIKCTKSIVGAVGSAGSDERLKGFDRKLGQVLEIIPLQDPTRLAVGDTLAFKVLFKGEPLMHAHVSVIPRGVTLPPLGVETPYDMMTDEDGVARFTFTEANYHLIVVHQETDEAGTLDGKDYSFTKYAAALTTIVKPSRPGTAEEGKGDVLSAGIALLSYMGDLLLGAAR